MTAGKPEPVVPRRRRPTLVNHQSIQRRTRQTSRQQQPHDDGRPNPISISRRQPASVVHVHSRRPRWDVTKAGSYFRVCRCIRSFKRKSAKRTQWAVLETEDRPLARKRAHPPIAKIHVQNQRSARQSSSELFVHSQRHGHNPLHAATEALTRTQGVQDKTRATAKNHRFCPRIGHSRDCMGNNTRPRGGFGGKTPTIRTTRADGWGRFETKN